MTDFYIRLFRTPYTTFPFLYPSLFVHLRLTVELNYEVNCLMNQYLLLSITIGHT